MVAMISIRRNTQDMVIALPEEEEVVATRMAAATKIRDMMIANILGREVVETCSRMEIKSFLAKN